MSETVTSDLILNEIAKKHGATVSQVSLAWAMQHGISVLPKSVNANRIEENFGAVNCDLTDEEMRQIDSLNKMVPCTSCDPWTVI